MPTTLRYIVFNRYFSDEHISTFNSSPVSRRPHSSKSVRMHHLASLVSAFSKQFQLLKHHFKLHRMHHLASLLSKFPSSSNFQQHRFNQRPTLSCNGVEVVLDYKFCLLYTIYCLGIRGAFLDSSYFLVLIAQQFQLPKNVSNSARMHHSQYRVSEIAWAK